jgi:hypothetical protein
MNHRLQCRCGALRGHVSNLRLAVRGVCYCKDCRAYAQHLGQLAATHDTAGGAEFVATQAMHVSFEGDSRQLACLSLSKRGLLRWYAQCCNTPIANTTRNWRFPYAGLLHTCLKADPAGFEQSFPKLQMRVNTGSAIQAPPSMKFATVAALLGFMPRVMASGINGAYRQTPFFLPPAGAPRVAVQVLSRAERDRAYEAA